MPICNHQRIPWGQEFKCNFSPSISTELKNGRHLCCPKTMSQWPITLETPEGGDSCRERSVGTNNTMGANNEVEVGVRVDVAPPPPQVTTGSEERSPIIEFVAILGSIVLLIVTCPITIWFCFKVVQQYERAVIFRLGRLKKGGARGPGIFFVLPCTDNYAKIDLRTVSFDVPPQEILTKDSVTVSVDAVVYYKIADPLKAVISVSNYSASTRLLAATTLRNVLGTRNLSETLSDREHIQLQMKQALDVATDPWGVQVERVEMKDVRLPTQMQRAMAAEAEASREARAKVIAAEGEMKASRALKEAADVIGESPAALQLRYLQTLTQISTEKNSTIIFPLPMDIVSAFLPKRD